MSDVVDTARECYEGFIVTGPRGTANIGKRVRYANRVIAALAAFLIAGTMIPAPAGAVLPDPKPHIVVVDLPASAYQSREEAAARSDRAGSVRGFQPSLYRGRYFDARQEAFRKCVGFREGSFVYVVRGGGNLVGDSRGDYYGTYQFSYKFQNGIPYMMAKESRQTKDGLRKEALSLRNKPINKWGRYWQDRAFYTVLNYTGQWSGKHHWAGGRWHC